VFAVPNLYLLEKFGTNGDQVLRGEENVIPKY